MFYRLLPLFVIVLASIKSMHFVLASEAFGAFVVCLQRNGLNISQVLERSSSAEYNTLNYQEQSYPRHISPRAYIMPECENHVNGIVSCASLYRIQIVPRSGGHSGEKYSFGDSSTVVIDLQKLNSVTLDTSNMTARVGSGTQLGPLLQKLWQLGKRFFPTGSCPTVGIGGHATGGGHGFLSRTYGLAVDYLVEVNIVVANGSLLTANSANNSDLYWAIRGAGAHSFGIITSFVFKTLSAPSTVKIRTLRYEIKLFAQAFLAWQYFTENGTRNISGEFNVFPDRGIEIYLFDPTGGNFEEIDTFFPSASTQNTTEVFTFPEFLHFQSYDFPGEQKMATVKETQNLKINTKKKAHIVGNKSFFVQKVMDIQEIFILQKMFEEEPATATVRFEAYGGAINDVQYWETAFVHRRGRLSNAVLNFEESENETLNTQGLEWINEFYETGKQLFKGSETYQNYVDGQLEDYLERYYSSNVKELIGIKRKYDPGNYFRYPQSIPV